MPTRLRGFVVCLILAGPPTLAAAGDTVQQILARMDKAASEFRLDTVSSSFADNIPR